MENWKLRQEVCKIVERHTKEIPYEGTEINRPGIVDDVIAFFNAEVKVYEFRWESMGYGSGVMLVAAMNLEDAIEEARNNDKHWLFNCESNLLYTGKPNLPCVILESYYQE